MNIGELARRTGVSVRSLRYYEEKQLLTPQRGENGYRSYDPSAIERVRAIQFYLGLGLSTSEILDVVLCSEHDHETFPCDGTTNQAICPEEVGFYQDKLAEIEAQIASLEKARTYIKQRLDQTRKVASV
jgi:DNA-binding transcriptional MerR regulator